MERGKPTGIKLGDVINLGQVRFEGQRAQIIGNTDTGGSMEILRLGFGDRHLALHGYYRGDEFMEVSRERLD